MLIGAEVQCNIVVRWAGIFCSDYYNIDKKKVMNIGRLYFSGKLGK